MSGLGGIYPPGLKVGKVASVARPENSPNAVVRLELFANLRTLEEVYYLMPAE